MSILTEFLAPYLRPNLVPIDRQSADHARDGGGGRALRYCQDLRSWRVLLGLDLMDTIIADTYPADPLPYLLTDPRRVEMTSSEDALWLRIIDIPATLEARSYKADLSAVVRISDTKLRDSTFALTIRDGKAQVVPTNDTPDLHTDLSVLGSIYFGAHRPSTFAAAHRLRCNDNHLLKRLDLAFASEVPADLGYGF